MLSYETINTKPRSQQVVRNQMGGPVITKNAPPQTINQGGEQKIVVVPHEFPFISNDTHYKPVKRTAKYEIKKLEFPDSNGEVIWASLKINVLATNMTHKIKSEEPILYTVISGKFRLFIYQDNDEYSDTLAPTEKAAIPPGLVHRFINTYDDRNSVVVGEFPYDVMVSENNISGKKEELQVSIGRPHQSEENLETPEVPPDQPKQSQQPHPHHSAAESVESEPEPVAAVPQPQKKTKTRNPPQK
jgi:hypothetical protein